MISPVITFVFTVGYLGITLFLCRGLRLGVRDIAVWSAPLHWSWPESSSPCPPAPASPPDPGSP